MVKNPCFVYLVNQPGTRHFKIGQTSAPVKRIQALKCANPYLVFYAIFIGTAHDERYLHRRFKQSRISGEWFVLNPSDLEFIRDFFFDKYISTAAEYFDLFSKELANVSNASIKMPEGLIVELLGRKHVLRPPETRKAIMQGREVNLTTAELKEIKQIGLSEKSSKAAKYILLENPDISAVEMAAKMGYSISFCQKAIALLKRVNYEHNSSIQ